MSQVLVTELIDRFEQVTSVSMGQDAVVIVPRDILLDVAGFLKEKNMDAPVACTVIDWLGKANARFEVVYQLRSTTQGYRLRMKTPLDSEDLVCPSLTEFWSGFNWQEREAYDMYGVVFEGHPDLRRILMYEEFSGHPLRKDYPKDKRQPLIRRKAVTNV